MPKWTPKSCSRCKVKAADGHVISKRGLCRPCATEAVERSIRVARAVKDGDMETVAALMGPAGGEAQPTTPHGRGVAETNDPTTSPASGKVAS